MEPNSRERPGPTLVELRASGLTNQEIARILTVKLLYNNGYFQDETPEVRRQRFVRWLFQNGRLRS